MLLGARAEAPGASHLPRRRSRQNRKLFLSRPLGVGRARQRLGLRENRTTDWDVRLRAASSAAFPGMHRMGERQATGKSEPQLDGTMPIRFIGIRIDWTCCASQRRAPERGSATRSICEMSANRIRMDGTLNLEP